ncbi:MAG: response regulator, partial [Spirochaetia bacterium]|nr:response regulator [Spirochaetia bacterium]
SKMNAGTEIALSIPLAPSGTHSLIKMGSVIPTGTPDDKNKIANDKKTILVVDDDEGSRFAAGRILENSGYNILFTANGERALSLIEQSNVNLVVLDVMMPGMNGFEVCRKIRELPDCKDMPVIMVTALGRNSDFLEGMKAGASDFLSKPFTNEEFILRVKNLLLATETENMVQDAIFNEQKKFNEDLHDHLGAHLLDMEIMLNKINKQSTVESETVNDLNESFNNIKTSIRQRIDWSNDLFQMKNDFFSGIRTALIRRYAASDRFILFKLNFKPEKKTVFSTANRAGENLIAVILEIASNDLKYGFGKSIYNLDIIDSKLHFSFSASTLLDTAGKNGHGKGNIQKRILEIGGSVSEEIRDRRYSLEFEIPEIDL